MRAFPASAGGGLLCAALLLAASASGALGQDRKAQADYLLRCSGCHGTDGAGTEEGGIPPFPGFVDPLLSDDEGRTYVMHVPGVVGSSLDDAAIAAVMNYVAGRWGTGGTPPFTEAEVAERRARPVADLVAYRRAIVKRLEAAGIRLADYPWP